MVPTEFLAFAYILLCFGIFGISFVILEAFEALIPDLVTRNSKSKFKQPWHTFFRPALPIIIGCIFGIFVVQYPYPEILINTFENALPGRILYGISAGVLSWIVVGGIKMLIRAKIKKEKEG